MLGIVLSYDNYLLNINNPFFNLKSEYKKSLIVSLVILDIILTLIDGILYFSINSNKANAWGFFKRLLISIYSSFLDTLKITINFVQLK